MSWHLTIHARPECEIARRPAVVRLREVSVLELPSHWLTSVLPVSFEHVVQRLEQLPRLFIEPDGSFIWIGPRGPEQWTIDGQLHDSAQGLMTVELKIRGTQPAIDDVLRCLDWPATRIVWQLVREGIYVDHDSLCRLFDLPSQLARTLP
jgi:hypothetical protein